MPHERYTPLDFPEKLMNGNVKHSANEKFEHGNTGVDSSLACNQVHIII